MQHSLDLQWPPEDLQELALPTPENQMAASYLKKCAIQRNKKDILAKENLSLSAEATINAAGKDRIYVIFFLEYKDRDLITHESHCHHLCYKSFTHSDSCSFPKASPMINPENASTYPLLLLQSENTNVSVRKQ